MLGTMSVKLAYKKAGIKWEDVDLQGMGIDNESLAKELAVRPKKTVFTNKPKVVGPKDLLRALGYSEYGHPLAVQKWAPGEKSYDFPQFVRPDGVDAPFCKYQIPYVAPTGNEVSPYVGCEKYEDLGATVRFYLPYVYIAQSEEWYRMSAGTDPAIGVMGCKHYALILRLGYEDGSMKADGEWRRHYPITAHNELEQLYYRGHELHAPAWTAYYKKGKSYNDVQHFDVRKMEFSLEEIAKRKKAEAREKVKLELQAKAREHERKQILLEMAEEAEKEDIEMKKNVMEKARKAEGDNLEKLSKERDKREMMEKMKFDMVKKMSQSRDV